ncbi:MAG: PstS family phosphate ABC transporter substrate-binding protein [Armatimonadetes bacterium]|nr:PstS family phosphate ABC transporter substrate-binding protein [Armatimonadota bacterium]
MRTSALPALALAAVLAGCQTKPPEPAAQPAPPAAPSNLSGKIAIDGSSTVYPITEAVAEEFGKTNPGVQVTAGISGTGGGFKKFSAGETDLSDASRPIKSKEAEACKAKGIEYIELPVAFDGLSVMVNPQNTFCESLTVAELNKIWEPGSKVNNWKDVRAGFPDQPLKLYGPGTDSGTFDYFTDAVNGKEGACRSDFTASEDDNVLVTGIAGDPNALGFFGYAYFAENQGKLKLVAIDPGDGKPVKPSDETISSGTYKPLSRPIFLYVKTASAARPEVDAFVRFYLQNAPALVKQVGYTPLPQAAYDLAIQRYVAKKTGSIFSGGSQIGVKIEDLLAKE